MSLWLAGGLLLYFLLVVWVLYCPKIFNVDSPFNTATSVVYAKIVRQTDKEMN